MSGYRNVSALEPSVLLIPNLHCSSCVTHIEEALYNLVPRPSKISHSIVNHTITVYHTPSLPLSTICEALDRAGFEIFDPPTQGHEKGHAQFGSAVRRWSYGFLSSSAGRNDAQLARKRQRHAEYCTACEQQEQGHEHSIEVNGHTERNGHVEPAKHRRSSSVKDLVSVTSGDAEDEKSYVVTLSIEGMTCSSCTGKVNSTLKELPYVESANVSLLTNSAKVVLRGKSNADGLPDAVEELGYGATVESVVPKVDTQKEQPQVWQASFSIEGMTCASCVGNVSKAIRELPFVKKVDVNLISNSATVLISDRTRVEEIVEAVDDVGYGAELQGVATLSRTAAATDREVSFKIDDMYCEHCPEKLAKALEQFDRLTVDKLPSQDDPILKVTYTPDAPTFTIRHIMKALSKADSEFQVSVYHPMTLEERSKRMQRKEQNAFLYRAILSFIIAIPTLVVGIVYMTLVPLTDPTAAWFMERLHGVTRAEWTTFALSTPVYFFAADVFHTRTIKELRALWRRGSPTPVARRFYRFGSMNMLVSLGTSIAYFSSLAQLIISASGNGSGVADAAPDSYFDSVVFLTLFLLIGRLIEAYSKAKTGDAISELGKLRATEALLVLGEGDEVFGVNKPYTDDETAATNNGSVCKVPLDEVEIGDTVRVLNGAAPPCDGIIISGTTTFDESSLTGESRPVSKSEGAQVFSGTINHGNAISIKVTGVSGSSMLDSIMVAVREGQAKRAPVERIADLVTGYFVPIVTLIAIIDWLVWLTLGLSGSLPADYLDDPTGGWPFWSLQFAIAVFVVACPCGIGLAAPTALFVGGGLAAEHGILVRGGGEAFQEASQLDAVVFDKTGTLTLGGEPKITGFNLLSNENDIDEKTALAIMKRIEEDSSHPIAKAAVSYASSKEGLPKLKADDVEEIPGKGLRAVIKISDRKLDAILGNESLMVDYGVQISEQAKAQLRKYKTQGSSVALVATRAHTNNSSSDKAFNLSAYFATSDPLRPEAKDIVTQLQRRKIEVYMLTGDNQITAHAVASQLGISTDHVIADVLPSGKADKIRYLQRSLPSRTGNSTASVAMVGDGINDSPALSAASVSIALASGSDIALSSSSFVLLNTTAPLRSILTLLDLSRVVFQRVKANFFWAAIYNIIALPVAAGVLYSIKTEGGAHVRLDPVWASLAMALSSVSVVVSSLALRVPIWGIGYRERKY